MRTALYMADTVFLRDPEIFRRLYERAGNARRDKIDRMRPDQGKRLTLGADALLRRALRSEGIPEIPTAAFGENGKPYFPDHPGLHFNLSHSGERVLCVLSEEPCGCDAERISGERTMIADRFFAREECAWLHSLPEEAVPEAFTALWTLKESYLKAIGVGLTRPLNSFALIPGPGPATPLFGVEEGWRLYAYAPEKDYRLACCVKDNERPGLILVPPEALSADL